MGWRMSRGLQFLLEYLEYRHRWIRDQSVLLQVSVLSIGHQRAGTYVFNSDNFSSCLLDSLVNDTEATTCVSTVSQMLWKQCVSPKGDVITYDQVPPAPGSAQQALHRPLRLCWWFAPVPRLLCVCDWCYAR